jgi:hypothetical protein
VHSVDYPWKPKDISAQKRMVINIRQLFVKNPSKD